MARHYTRYFSLWLGAWVAKGRQTRIFFAVSQAGRTAITLHYDATVASKRTSSECIVRLCYITRAARGKCKVCDMGPEEIARGGG